MVSRAEFVDYLCETYALNKEQIEAFGGANVACYTTGASTTPGRGGAAPHAPGEGGREAKTTCAASSEAKTTRAASSASPPSRESPEDVGA